MEKESKNNDGKGQENSSQLNQATMAGTQAKNAGESNQRL